ncbi:hypothetical protein CAFE_23540 [Caprobacter fermentans]|uniref:Uncharacterized protein n=1 Tax=Caproicibacter fermentans TaxID=2576756 RepID=A0A6N8I0S7_9FIRM|nr:MobC family plasmid mobilization relaxosome protein [Caproicibacter fermentans]MVB11632.1 hypothetical protein [Caproicibacter fermentans]
MGRKRSRNVPQLFYISEKEAQFLKVKMKEAGIRNKSAYLRKMALDGYIIRKDYTELKSMVTAVNRIGNNLNQMTKIANTYGGDAIQVSELKAIREVMGKIWRQLTSMG